MEILKSEVTNTQKECCAILSLREAVALIAANENVSYENALLKFARTPIYSALFDFSTGIWKESAVYVAWLFTNYVKTH